jgi:hypothetical protein
LRRRVGRCSFFYFLWYFLCVHGESFSLFYPASSL